MFSYNITNIRCASVSGRLVVKEFFFKVTCIHNNQTDYSIVPVYVEEGPAFTPFSELTEQQMVQWAKDYLGPEEVASIENGLLAVLESSTILYNVSTPWKGG